MASDVILSAKIRALEYFCSNNLLCIDIIKNPQHELSKHLNVWSCFEVAAVEVGSHYFLINSLMTLKHILDLKIHSVLKISMYFIQTVLLKPTAVLHWMVILAETI